MDYFDWECLLLPELCLEEWGRIWLVAWGLVFRLDWPFAVDRALNINGNNSNIISMEIYAAPKLPRYTTALGAYNSKSFMYEINQRMYMHARMHTRAQRKRFTEENMSEKQG